MSLTHCVARSCSCPGSLSLPYKHGAKSKPHGSKLLYPGKPQQLAESRKTPRNLKDLLFSFLTCSGTGAARNPSKHEAQPKLGPAAWCKRVSCHPSKPQQPQASPGCRYSCHLAFQGSCQPLSTAIPADLCQLHAPITDEVCMTWPFMRQLLAMRPSSPGLSQA